MCYIFDCASNITFSSNTAVSSIGDICFAYPTWLPILGVGIGLGALAMLVLDTWLTNELNKREDDEE